VGERQDANANVDPVGKADSDALVSELRSHDATLKKQLEANRENRRIIAALTSRIPEIEAPSEDSESSTEGMAQADRGMAEDTTQEATARPWWQRLLGG
jgi:hypothetical protein